MKRSIALSILLTGITVTGNPGAAMPVAFDGALTNALAGKSGAGLVEAISRECRPAISPDINDVTYTFHDPFSGKKIVMTGGQLPAGYVAGSIVPPGWWSTTDELRDAIEKDLNNFWPMTLACHDAKAMRVPGVVTDVTVAFDSWCAGRGELNGSTVDLYEPPVAMRGRIARTFFYMAAVYHACGLEAEGFMMLSERYPYLTPYAVRLLGQWAREQAPDDAEIAWAQYVGRLQGSVNPFVSNPELADYIWGDKSGQAYGPEGSPVPLHSTYSMKGDRIYLTSPLIPADAKWSINGMPAMADSYDPRDLGAGEHHLAYTSASTGQSGVLMIKVISE